MLSQWCARCWGARAGVPIWKHVAGRRIERDYLPKGSARNVVEVAGDPKHIVRIEFDIADTPVCCASPGGIYRSGVGIELHEIADGLSIDVAKESTDPNRGAVRGDRLDLSIDVGNEGCV